MVNDNTSDKGVVGFEDYDEEYIDRLEKVPDLKYEDTRDMIFDLMDD